MKRNSIKNHYGKITDKLRSINPHKFYGVVKEICSSSQNNAEIEIEALRGKSPKQGAECIAEYFSKVSQSYEPVNFSSLPSYLPALPPPQVTELEVWEKMKKLKNTLSTHPIDLPSKLRNLFGIF